MTSDPVSMQFRCTLKERLIAQDVSSYANDGIVYRTTEKGREFLQHYTRLKEYLGEVKEKEQQEQPNVKLDLNAF